MEMELTPAQAHFTILDLVCFPVLCTRVLCMSSAGFTTGMLFYGISLDLQNLGSGIQMLQVLLGVSTLLSRLGVLFLMNRLGRQTISVACLLLAGLLILAAAFLPQGILSVVLAMLGINCIVVSISTISVYSPELPPTVVRTTCRGFICPVDQIGAMLAPILNTPRHNIAVMPQIIFAILAITASLVSFFFLPEAQNQPMPDTVNDIECGHSREEGIPTDEGNAAVKISQF